MEINPSLVDEDRTRTDCEEIFYIPLDYNTTNPYILSSKEGDSASKGDLLRFQIVPETEKNYYARKYETIERIVAAGITSFDDPLDTSSLEDRIRMVTAPVMGLFISEKKPDFIVQEVTKDLKVNLDYDSIINGTVDKIKETFNLGKCEITLIDFDKDRDIDNGMKKIIVTKRYSGKDGYDIEAIKRMSTPGMLIYSSMDYITHFSDPLVCFNIKSDPYCTEAKNDPGFSDTEQWATIPMYISNKVMGYVHVAETGGGLFNTENVRNLKRVIDEITILIRNAELYKRVKELNLTDDLTGIPNFSGFKGAYRLIVEPSLRNNSPVSIAHMDIDHFKRFNDMYGHDQGDRVIKRVARFFPLKLRSSDYFARTYQGDEFIALLPNTSVVDAYKCLKSIYSEFQKTAGKITFVDKEGRKTEENIKLSMGLISTELAKDMGDIELALDRPAMLSILDKLFLYKAKEKRNKIVYYLPMSQQKKGLRTHNIQKAYIQRLISSAKDDFRE